MEQSLESLRSPLWKSNARFFLCFLEVIESRCCPTHAIHTFASDRMMGGSIVGDMAPYQAFAIGGLGSVRGYGEGAVGSGRSCLVANSEITFPLVC